MLLSSEDYTCEHPDYKVLVFSRSPLVIYITDFITPAERRHFLALASDTFTRSAVIDTTGSTSHNQGRTSQSTSVPRDAVVRCIQSRALAFQGLPPSAAHRLEPLQLVKYGVGERYHFHTDWFTDPAQASAARGGNRATSFFGYVSVSNDTAGGGTNFPLLEAPSYDHRSAEDAEWWCGIVDCDAEWEDGVTFRPVEGNAVYWENLVPGGQQGEGEGEPRTLHAGLPVLRGSKVGMNIWTRQGELGEDIRGPAV
ncbi:oxidoreductase [Sodiomyces alkalinus F11]|uniref:Oxidoreductase n=1 Tax=Sodiomyces alkalinus (strain CBS 110278 / VKM F-3762 / F11) TaxID=1314773 RepID=A0A3N2PKY9_SODAK|nr:oxidoreductase [Sodiomyces alkalinus F11]ROT35080.1 oxidoreductase [Sodiomyces alkalinus F11]